MPDFKLPPEQEQQFLQMLQSQGGAPGGGEMSPEVQQAAIDQGAQAAQADLAAQGADAPAAPAPEGQAAPAVPGAPAAAPAQVPGMEALQALGFGDIQSIVDAFSAQAEQLGQAKEDLGKLLGFQQALENEEELNPKDPNYNTRKILRETVGPLADEFKKQAKQRALAEAWNMDAQGMEDVQGYMADINAYLQGNPELATQPTGFKQAYHAVKAGKHRTEDQLFGDPEFVKKASSNKAVKDAAIQAYLADLARNGEVPPAVGPGGGTPLTNPGAKIKSIEDAGKALGRILGVK